MKPLSLLAFLLSCNAMAAVIFNQGPPPAGPNGFSIDASRLADDFTLSAATTLQRLTFHYQWAVFGDSADLSSVSYAIYQNNAGTPGALIQSQTGLAYTANLQPANCNECATAAFDISPLALAAGTFWLEIHAGNSLTSDNGGFSIYWATVADNGTAKAHFNASGVPNTPVSNAGFQQYGFLIEGLGADAPVPEPGVAGMVLGGLACLFFGSRRRWNN